MSCWRAAHQVFHKDGLATSQNCVYGEGVAENIKEIKQDNLLLKTGFDANWSSLNDGLREATVTSNFCTNNTFKDVKLYFTVDFFTFSDAECVVSTSNEVIKCNKEVRVTLSRPQKVFLGAPAHSLCQSFWERGEFRGQKNARHRSYRSRATIHTIKVFIWSTDQPRCSLLTSPWPSSYLSVQDEHPASNLYGEEDRSEPPTPLQSCYLVGGTLKASLDPIHSLQRTVFVPQ